MKWVVSCFEPFDKAQSNSSQVVWNHLKQLSWNGKVEFVGPLPVTFGSAWRKLESAVRDCDGVLALGQAEMRAQVSLECIALNWIDARIPDNEGAQPRLCPVRPGPEVLWSQIPWEKLGENEMWSRSYSAGTFVCNALMYEIVNWAKTNSKMGGFVHIPVVESQTDAQFQGMKKMSDAQALRACESVVNFLTGLNG